MNTKLRVLRAAARRPLLALAVAAASVIGAGAVTVGALSRGHENAPPPDALEPRAILGRAWFDKYPEKRTDTFNLLLFFGGGIGIHDQGSSYRSTLDVFEFERQNDKVLVTHLHDKKKLETSFKITKCDDDPPFNVCLDLDKSPGGPKRYHGFFYDDEMDAAIPWARSMVRAEEERARAK